MSNDLKGAEHQRVALRARAAVFRADGAGPNHVEVPRKRSVVPAPDVAKDCRLKFRHDVQGEVVRNVCLYYPNSFGFLVPKPCKTAKFFNPLNVFSMSPVFVTTPFLEQKALKTANSEKCVFRALRLLCRLGLQIRSFSAENLLQVFAVLRNPYSALKNMRIPAR